MKAILYSVVILAAGGAALFTYKHSQKFEALQKDRLQTTVTDKTVSAHADAKEADLNKEKKVLVDSDAKLIAVNQRVSTLKAEGAALEREVTALKAKLKDQEEQLAQVLATLNEINKTLADLGGGLTLENLSEKKQQLKDEQQDRSDKLKSLEKEMDTAEKNLQKNREDVARLAKRTLERNERIGRNAMEAVISSVDQDWGFLVIGAGSNSGFSPQTPLIVMRDGRMIGRVRPSSIEPTQTIAEIDFKSLAGGVRLQPGDRVNARQARLQLKNAREFLSRAVLRTCMERICFYHALHEAPSCPIDRHSGIGFRLHFLCRHTRKKTGRPHF
jgi:hypothetical protein